MVNGTKYHYRIFPNSKLHTISIKQNALEYIIRKFRPVCFSLDILVARNKDTTICTSCELYYGAPCPYYTPLLVVLCWVYAPESRNGHFCNLSNVLCIAMSPPRVVCQWYNWRSSHWGWDKMAATLQTIFSMVYSFMKMFESRLNLLIDNKPALVQVMTWRQTGDKPLSGPVQT